MDAAAKALAAKRAEIEKNVAAARKVQTLEVARTEAASATLGAQAEQEDPLSMDWRVCASCGAAAKFRCTGCKSIGFCTRKCQKRNFKQGMHKQKCRELNAVRLVQEQFDRCVTPPLGAGASCTVCLGGTEDDDLWQQGCACRGDAGLVHLECLAQLAYHKELEPGCDRDPYNICGICKQAFSGAIKMGMSLKQWARVQRSWDASQMLPGHILEDNKSAPAGEKIFAARSLAFQLSASTDGPERHSARIALLTQIVELSTAHWGPDNGETLATNCDLANALLPGKWCTPQETKQAYSQAEGVYRNLIPKMEIRLSESDSKRQGRAGLWTAKAGLARVIHYQGKFKEAERAYRSLREEAFKCLGPEDPCTVGWDLSLAMTMNEQGKHGGAEVIAEAALKTARRVLGPGHDETVRGFEILQRILMAQNNHVRLEQMLRENIRDLTAANGPEHRNTLAANSNLGACLCNYLNRSAEAVAIFHPTLASMRRVLGLADEYTMNTAASWLAALSRTELTDAELAFFISLECQATAALVFADMLFVRTTNSPPLFTQGYKPSQEANAPSLQVAQDVAELAVALNELVFREAGAQRHALLRKMQVALKGLR